MTCSAMVTPGLVLGLGRRRPQVGGDHHRGQLEQRRLGGRLLGEHVEAGPLDLAGPDGLGQRLLVDDAAPGRVDDAEAGLGLGQQVLPDQAEGLGVLRAGGRSRSRTRPSARRGPSARRPCAWPGRPRRRGRRPPAACRRPGPAGPPGRRPGPGRPRPRVLPCSSTPSHLDRSHLPATRAAWAWGMLRAWASSRAMACSAADRMFDWGALTTMTPRSVAAATSTLSSPMPARPTTTRSVPAASTSAVTVVAERMTRAWAPTTAATSSSGDRSELHVDLVAGLGHQVQARLGQLFGDQHPTHGVPFVRRSERTAAPPGRQEASPNSLASRETPSTRSSSPRA